MYILRSSMDIYKVKKAIVFGIAGNHWEGIVVAKTVNRYQTSSSPGNKTMLPEISVEELNRFIVQAKAATYVGDGQKTQSSRAGSHDLKFQKGAFSYLDSYFGGADFIGQEVVYYENEPIWAMNYYGRIIKPESITAAEAGQIIKASLSRLYQEGRFLGGFEFSTDGYTYTDTNQGGPESFTGKERITRDNLKVYELVYHGGLIKP